MNDSLYIKGRSRGSLPRSMRFHVSCCDPFSSVNKKNVMESKEIWKDIPEYQGLYRVSNTGSVQSFHGQGHTLNPMIYSNGYSVVKLCNSGDAKRYLVHRLVATLFVPNPQNKPQVNHKNGIKTDNRFSNLEWCTNKENHEHAARNKLKAHSQNHGMATLSNIDVIEIRNKISNGVIHRKIASEYGVARSTITSINTGINWKHLL